jgi:heptosyltransferase-2
MSDPAAIAVLAPNWLGDAVMALPAMTDVHRRYPAARLVVVARRAVADVFRLVTFVNEVRTLDGRGQWWRRRTLEHDIETVRATRADAVLLLPNSFASAWLASRARIPERWGYASDWRGRLLTRAVPRPRGSVHQGAYYQQLVRELGFDSGPLEPAVTVPGEAIMAARDLLAARGWDQSRPVVVLAPGAAYGTAKRWIPSSVAALVTDLVREGMTCVLVGSRADAPTTTQIREAVDGGRCPHVIDLAGVTTLEVLAATLSLARVCVCNDSGAMHLAAAVGTPVVALFGPTREWETSPLTRGGRRSEVLTNPVWCRPCMLRECPIDHRCMTGIPPRPREVFGHSPAGGLTPLAAKMGSEQIASYTIDSVKFLPAPSCRCCPLELSPGSDPATGGCWGQTP